jgi:hypothetical protein
MSPEQISLLREVLSHRRPDLMRFAADNGHDATAADRAAIQNALTDELIQTGLDEAAEPNYRGLQLEALIDNFGPRPDSS